MTCPRSSRSVVSAQADGLQGPTLSPSRYRSSTEDAGGPANVGYLAVARLVDIDIDFLSQISLFFNFLKIKDVQSCSRPRVVQDLNSSLARVEPRSPAVEAQSLNRWGTAKKVP